MANVIHRTTKQYLQSVNTPEYDPAEWIINPVLPDVAQKYWKISGDSVLEMNQSEKDAVDAAELTLVKSAKLEELKAESSRIRASEDQRYKSAEAQVNNARSITEVNAVTLPGA